MAIVNFILTHISGDVGGNGICKLAWQNATQAQPLPADNTAAAQCVFDMWNQVKLLVPSDITFTCDPVVQSVDVPSGALGYESPIPTIPTPITGADNGVYPAGTGARGYWHTSVIKNRRLVRGATFFAPLAGDAFTNRGLLAAGTSTTCQNAMGDYAVAMQSAGLTPVIYCRPTKLAPESGLVAAITAWSVGSTPASLRSRRS